MAIFINCTVEEFIKGLVSNKNQTNRLLLQLVSTGAKALCIQHFYCGINKNCLTEPRPL